MPDPIKVLLRLPVGLDEPGMPAQFYVDPAPAAIVLEWADRRHGSLCPAALLDRRPNRQALLQQAKAAAAIAFDLQEALIQIDDRIPLPSAQDAKHFLVVELRVPAHTQPRQRERDAILRGEDLKSAENDPTYRAARREMIQLVAAIDRLVKMHGYDVGGEGAVLTARVEVA